MTTEQPDSIRILLVDDDDAFRQSAEHYLRARSGFVVTSCSDGESARRLLASERFDVIVLDHMMPGVSGLNVLQWMDEQRLATPTLMLTAAGSEHISVEAMKLGAYDYIRKDHLELARLPVIVRGLHERHLFRQEKVRRERQRIRDEERENALRSVRSTIGFLIRSLTDKLNVVLRTIGTIEKEWMSPVKPDRKASEDLFRNLRLELAMLDAAVKSLESVARLLPRALTTADMADADTNGLADRLPNPQEPVGRITDR